MKSLLQEIPYHILHRQCHQSAARDANLQRWKWVTPRACIGAMYDVK